MNKVMLIGNLGKDPVMTYTPSGNAVTKFTIAVNRFSKGADGQRQKDTEWFDIVAWNQLAETCNTYLQKGSKVFVEGRLVKRTYTNKEGQERLAVEVVINEMEMLTPKESRSGQGSDSYANQDYGLGDDLDAHPF